MINHLYAIISDAHGNYNALLEVGRDARRIAREQNFPEPEFIFLGDAVDYGPQPNEVMHWLARNKPVMNVIGNHDQEAIAGLYRRPRSIDEAWWPITFWTRLTLKKQYHERINSWPIRKQASNSLGDFLLFHSDTYGQHKAPKDNERAAKVLREMNIVCPECSYGLFGHSHYQTLYICKKNGYCDEKHITSVFAGPEDISMDNEDYLPVNRWHEISFFTPALINPGGVGQPRSHVMQTEWKSDVRASYMLLYVDDKAVHFQWRRVEYDVEGVVNLLQGLEMPELPSQPHEGKDIFYENAADRPPRNHYAYLTPEEFEEIGRRLPEVTDRLVQVLLHGG